MITHPVTDRDLTSFCSKLASKTAKYFAKNYANLDPPTFTVDPKGRKYAKIVRRENCGNGCSVVCFIEKSTGLIWKAASWKAPAKNFHRGSIYMANEYTGGFDLYHNG